jgi:hypothetical protein
VALFALIAAFLFGFVCLLIAKANKVRARREHIRAVMLEEGHAIVERIARGAQSQCPTCAMTWAELARATAAVRSLMTDDPQGPPEGYLPRPPDPPIHEPNPN